MPVENYIVIALLALLVGGAVAYIVKAKKAGKKCIGCPYAATCGKKEGCTCSTTHTEEQK